MHFRKQITINGSKEDLSFVSWGGDTISHFVIIGLKTPVGMKCNSALSTWEFTEAVDEELKEYETVFSEIINEQLQVNGDQGCADSPNSEYSYVRK